tara:strand:+ start:170 stop:790 length:621 start_codon:yes stop_codon:yes gene_type:complete
MKIGLGILISALKPGGGGIPPKPKPEVIKPFLSTLEGGEGLAACDFEIDTTYYKNNGDEPLALGDKIYIDPEGTKPLTIEAWLAYKKADKSSGYYGMTKGSNIVSNVGNCPTPLLPFNSTIKPTETAPEACEQAEYGLLYKQGEGNVVKGDIIYKSDVRDNRNVADPGYYKEASSGNSFEIERFGRADDPRSCGPGFAGPTPVDEP